MCKVRKDLEICKDHIETVFAECLINNETLVIGMLYRRPDTSIERFFEDLVIILNKVNHKCILLGDFNLNLLDENYHVENLINIMQQHSYETVITKPTRVSKNSATLIDHIWTNMGLENLSDCSIVFTDISHSFSGLSKFKMYR